MKPTLITSGEPAGIGLNLCVLLAELIENNLIENDLIILANKSSLLERGRIMGVDLELNDLSVDDFELFDRDCLNVINFDTCSPVLAGVLDDRNSDYVIKMLDYAISLCVEGRAVGMVTCPVNKEIISRAGFKFSGHTSYIADSCGSEVLMMLCGTNRLSGREIRVALLTEHVSLSDVPKMITKDLLSSKIEILRRALKEWFGIEDPLIAVCGLNPHAGEGGYLGREEVEVISPVISDFKSRGFKVFGPISGDSAFLSFNLDRVDAILAMYHDQGLSALKALSFGSAVNVTLGLPIIRTSVDHGTALSLAKSKDLEVSSLLAAIRLARNLYNRVGG